jgi:hypothetical protein
MSDGQLETQPKKEPFERLEPSAMRLSCHFASSARSIIQTMLAVWGQGNHATVHPYPAILHDYPSTYYSTFALRVRIPTQCRTIIFKQGNGMVHLEFLSVRGVGLFLSAFRARGHWRAIGFRLWRKLK